LGKIHAARISERHKGLIFSENLHRRLRPILDAKAIRVE
jgi:hypothetical protein